MTFGPRGGSFSSENGFGSSNAGGGGEVHLHIAERLPFDMCKAADRGMVITDVRLEEKHGGRSGDWVATP